MKGLIVFVRQAADSILLVSLVTVGCGIRDFYFQPAVFILCVFTCREVLVKLLANVEEDY